MATAKELYDAAMVIKESCIKSKMEGLYCYLENGEKCPFNYIKNCLGSCSIAPNVYPLEWKIKKPRRFTDRDIEIAKAMKSIGVVTVFKKDGWSFMCDIDDKKICEFTPYEFSSLEQLEKISINEIIKEGEE